MMRGQRAGAAFSALSGALGMWVSVASVLPAIFLCAAAAFVVRPPAQAAGAWRLWGALGAAASLVFYAVEYFPEHMALRLEVNHPLHSVAWLAAGELVARRGERVARDAAARAWPWIALAAMPVTVLVGGVKVLSFTDPFVARLHSLHILEFAPLWTVLTKIRPEAGPSVAFVEAIPLIAALLTIAWWRRRTPAVLVFATLVTAALAAMAFWQTRWQLNACAGQVALAVILVDAWSAGRAAFVRAAVTAVVVALLLVPGYKRYAYPREAVARRNVDPKDAAIALQRDIAAALRASQPQGDIILLAGPNASTQIGYFGRFRTVGTLYWENGDGLKAAAAMFSARDDGEAQRLLRERRVTHVALVSKDDFIREYYRLLYPDASDAEVDRSFGWRLTTGEPPPAWLEPIAYEAPPDLKVLGTSVRLFKVR
jgi:hypothetical protein